MPQPTGWTPPGPQAPPPPQAPGWTAPPYGAPPPGGSYPPPQGGGYYPPQVPVPAGAWAPTSAASGRRRNRGRSPIVIVLSVILGIGAYFLARELTTDVISKSRDRDDTSSVSTSWRSGDDEASPTAADERFEVSEGDLTWSMRADPDESPISVPVPGAGTMTGTILSADVTDGGAESADLVIIYELEGRPFDLEGGIRGAVQGNSGEVLEGPSPITVAGQSGLMVTGTFERGGLSGIVRWGGAQVGDRVYVFGTVDEGSDRNTGKQDFADLIASVKPS